MPMTADLKFLVDTANNAPHSLTGVIAVLVGHFNKGLIHTQFLERALRLLLRLSEAADILRAEIADSISKDLLDYYCLQGDSRTAEQLAEELRIERPRHYFDIARNILASGSCVFVVGAGFSYDSYAPLLRETEGIACSTLYDLGIENPRELYKTDDRRAWQVIQRGWETFQQHMSAMLLPKEPASQHFVLAELFYEELVRHIVSFNWDDLIEKAYKDKFGEDIPKVTREEISSEHALWKLHGDVCHPTERWVLPYEEGRVFEALHAIVSRTTLPGIIVGYREQEPIVRTQLIEVMEQRGGLTRIRPDVEQNPPAYFRDNASMAMKKIRAGLETARKVGEYR